MQLSTKNMRRCSFKCELTRKQREVLSLASKYDEFEKNLFKLYRRSVFRSNEFRNAFWMNRDMLIESVTL